MAEWQKVYDPDLDPRQFLTFLQQESQKWRVHCFPPEHRSHIMQALGVAEEVGELCHGVLKMEQGIRGTRAEHIEEIKDSIGDICIYLAGICESLGLNFHACVYQAWLQVAGRDWAKHKLTGIEDERAAGAAAE